MIHHISQELALQRPANSRWGLQRNTPVAFTRHPLRLLAY